MVRAQPATGKDQILLVEDDADVRRSLILLLRGHGWNVRGYASAVAVLDEANIIDAQCLVADFSLPHINGIDLLLALRSRGWAGKALLISGFLSDSVSRQARTAGYDYVLEKPLKELLLPETIRRMLAPA